MEGNPSLFGQQKPFPTGWNGCRGPVAHRLDTQPAALHRVLFEAEPPATVRKSNFFSFSIQLQDGNGRGVRVRRASFVAFLHIDWPPEGDAVSPASPAQSERNARSRGEVCYSPIKHEAVGASEVQPDCASHQTPGVEDPLFSNPTRPGSRRRSSTAIAAPHAHNSNAIEYDVEAEYADGHITKEKLFLCLVDNRNREVVKYEGQDRNPEMRRVLLTHEVTCSRCSSGATGCGNKTAAPSDPVVERDDLSGKHTLKFFVKCNQNCLRSPGSPKQGRRFQLLVSTGANADDARFRPLGQSSGIFVHNNSKHGRQSSRNLAVDAQADSTSGVLAKEVEFSETRVPTIHLVWPGQGWTTGRQDIIILGDNFTADMQVLFGHQYKEAKVLTARVLMVRTPPVHQPCTVDITLMQRHGNKVKQSCTTMPGRFTYYEPDCSQECLWQRLQAALSIPLSESASQLSPSELLSRASEKLEMCASCQLCNSSQSVTAGTAKWHQLATSDRATKRSSAQETRASLQMSTGTATCPSTLNTPPLKWRPAPLVLPPSGCMQDQSTPSDSDVPKPTLQSAPPASFSSAHSAQWSSTCQFSSPHSQAFFPGEGSVRSGSGRGHGTGLQPVLVSADSSRPSSCSSAPAHSLLTNSHEDTRSLPALLRSGTPEEPRQTSMAWDRPQSAMAMPPPPTAPATTKTTMNPNNQTGYSHVSSRHAWEQSGAPAHFSAQPIHTLPAAAPGVTTLLYPATPGTPSYFPMLYSPTLAAVASPTYPLTPGAAGRQEQIFNFNVAPPPGSLTPVLVAMEGPRSSDGYLTQPPSSSYSM